jgi:hypothetical protein
MSEKIPYFPSKRFGYHEDHPPDSSVQSFLPGDISDAMCKYGLGYTRSHLIILNIRSLQRDKTPDAEETDPKDETE